jgi:hypothetical protein
LFVNVKRAGRFGNQICQAAFSFFVAQRLGADGPHGVSIPELGLDTGDSLPGGRSLPLTGHRVDLDSLDMALDVGRYDSVSVQGLGMRVEYLVWGRTRLESLSPLLRDLRGHPVADDEIVIHLRLGDALEGAHKDYYPLPLDFYRKICSETGKTPVFVGQLESGGSYLDQVMTAFPEARFVGGTMKEDWDTLRQARHKVLSISSFSWTAAWLGSDAGSIHMPLAGFFNPIQRGDVDLRPRDDGRFRFYWFHPMLRYRKTGLDEHLSRLASRSKSFARCP